MAAPGSVVFDLAALRSMAWTDTVFEPSAAGRLRDVRRDDDVVADLPETISAAILDEAGIA